MSLDLGFFKTLKIFKAAAAVILQYPFSFQQDPWQNLYEQNVICQINYFQTEIMWQ